MRVRLIGALVGASLLIVVVFSIPLIGFVSRVERDRLVTALERDAFVLAGHAKETLNTTAGSVLPSLQPFIDEFSATSRAKVVVTNSEGLAVSSNDETVAVGRNFSNRPEVAAALTGKPSVGERESVTLGEQLVFVAVPVLLGDEVLGVVRLSNPKSVVDEEVRDRVLGIVLAGIFTLIAAAAFAVPVALGIARPITRLTRRTEKLATGDFSVRADDAVGPPEVRELSRSFNAMAGRLGLLIEGQRQFANSVSHQLRTPLTALRLRLEQAQEMTAEDSELGQILDASRHEADRLQEMVEQLLALARLEGGSTPTITVDVSDIVASRVAMWGPLADEKNVSLRTSVPSGTQCSAIDGALQQIIDNYVDNALSVAPAGSAIEILVARSGAYVILDVLDHGVGLSDEDRAKAFERFWRGKTSENTAGTGLGLTIVRQLAVASGATVELLPRSDGTQGTCARVTLLAR
jgi:signal transduction histidine kinase